MPKIPVADSQATINVGTTPRISTPRVNAPRINVPEMPLTSINKSAQAQSEVIQAIAQVEDKLVQIRDFRQQTEAQNFSFERLNSIKSAADQDTDFDSAKYETEIDKVGTEAAKTITGRLAKEEFMAGFQKQVIATKWGIKNDFRAKELKSIDASIDYQSQQIIDNYGGMNDADRITNVANYRRSLENGVKVGLYNKGTADAKYAKFQHDIVKGNVEYGILNNPQYALQELQQGDEGEYHGLTQTERVNFIKEAETRVEKLANQEKETIAIATNKRESDLIDMKIAGNLTVPQVKAEREVGNITARFADSMIKALESPKTIKAKTKSAKFVGFVNDMLYNKINPKDIDLALMEANTAGALSDDDFDLLVTFNQDVNKSQKLEQLLPNVSFMKGIQYWGDENAGARNDSKQRMFRNYMNKVRQGKDPETASIETIKEETLSLFPQAKTAGKEGIDIIDLNGVIKHITPDGELTIVNKKKEK